MNPYFTISTIFLLGLRGIRNKIPLSFPPTSHYGEGPGKLPKSSIKKLAITLADATKEMMKSDSIAREIFGDAFVDHYGGTREHEVRVWQSAVTSWEGKLNDSFLAA